MLIDLPPENPFGKFIFHGFHQRLIERVTAAKAIKFDASIRKIHAAANQPMRPARVHQKRLAQEKCLPFFVGSANENHSAMHTGWETWFPVVRHGKSQRSLGNRGRVFAAMSLQEPDDLKFQIRLFREGKPVPNRLFPRVIEPFDFGLRTRFVRNREHDLSP